MLLLSVQDNIHLCTKHPKQNTAQSRASVAFDGKQFSIRDAITAAYGDKQRVPKGNEFTVYIDSDTEIHFSYRADSETVGITMPHNIQAMREALMKKSGWEPEWTR